MKSTQNYSPDAVKDLYTKILNQRRLGTIRDFEIFIDNISIVPRTNDINLFLKYKTFLNQNNRTLAFKLYYGTSRANDFYNFNLPLLVTEIKKKQESESGNQLFIDELQSDIRILEQDNEYLEKKRKKLKSKLKELEKQIISLRKENKELKDSGGTIDMVSKVLPMLLQKVNPESQNADSSATNEARIVNPEHGAKQNQESTIAGLDSQSVQKIYDDLKQTLSDDEFQAIFGIFVTVAEYKELITPTKEFLTTKIELIKAKSNSNQENNTK